MTAQNIPTLGVGLALQPGWFVALAPDDSYVTTVRCEVSAAQVANERT